MKDVLILYGSQTGNSEDIAKDLHEKCQKGSIKSVCQQLNTMKKVDVKEIAKFIIIVCSTTGNGDVPENADGWWRSIKLRAAPKDTFADIPYAVMGLGDTNYDQFCHMGKVIDKRLSELGGKRSLPLCCADEATGLEETVEAWKSEIMTLLTKLDQLVVESAVIAENTIQNDVVTIITPEGEVETSIETAPLSVTSIPKEIGIPVGLLNLSGVSESLQLEQKISSPPESSQLPNCKKVISNGPSVEITSSSFQLDSETIPVDGWSAKTPFAASIVGAKWLTSSDNINEDESIWGQNKRVLHLELNRDNSGIEYLPGDSVGICCPNPSYLVEIVLKRLLESHTDSLLSLDSTVAITASGVNETCSLREVLTYKLDLSGIPRKINVLALAEFCTEEKEKADLQWLCSKGDVGKELWSQFIEGQRIGLGELLFLFPSCKVTLATLLACCGTMPPRLYSIASSPLSAKDSLTIAFSCVRYTCGITKNGVQSQTLNRHGVCTTYLERLLWDRLGGSIIPENEKVRIFLKPSISFRLPGSTSHPLMLIGPGTGVAPFVGFLQHRAILERERKSDGDDITTGTWRGGLELLSEDLPHECNNVRKFIHSTPAGDIMLFFGCRDDKDYLYKDELESKVNDKTLTILEVAKSRMGTEKVYVTHKILERGAEIAKYILQEGGYVYICGDGNSMAKDVNAAIKSVLKEHGGLTEEQVDTTIDEMKLRRKYVLDIWS